MKKRTWIDRRGQADAANSISLVIDQQPQPGEQIQHLRDDLIEDSPYQARLDLDPTSLAELTQSMKETGFQGVLIVRPHPNPEQQQRGIVQLIYGHRRRIAWRQICIERSLPCLIPVVVRPYSDAQVLTIGAQENLQRQDLDPVEEGRIVHWYTQLYSDKNQAEIGALLGKSVDWVKIRARINNLPDPLKERLRQRPRSISQMLELAPLYTQDPALALALADQIVQEELTLNTVRLRVRKYTRPSQFVREEKHNQSGATLKVPDFTKLGEKTGKEDSREEKHNQSGATLKVPDFTKLGEKTEEEGGREEKHNQSGATLKVPDFTNTETESLHQREEPNDLIATHVADELVTVTAILDRWEQQLSQGGVERTIILSAMTDIMNRLEQLLNDDFPDLKI